MTNLTQMEIQRKESWRKSRQERKNFIRQNILEVVPELQNNPFVRIPLSCKIATYLPIISHDEVNLNEFSLSFCNTRLILMCIRCGAVFLAYKGEYGICHTKFYGYGNPNKKRPTYPLYSAYTQ